MWLRRNKCAMAAHSAQQVAGDATATGYRWAVEEGVSLEA
jgi:hypothetical protein